MRKKYAIHLQREERDELVRLTRRGRASARMISRAHILLMADKGLDDDDIVKLLNVSLPTVGRIRKRFNQEGLESAIVEKPRPGAARKINGEQREALQELLTTEPPLGYTRWSLRLIANRLVELKLVDSVSHETIRAFLKERD